MSCTAGLRAKPDANPANFASMSAFVYAPAFTQLTPSHVNTSPVAAAVITICDRKSDGAFTTQRCETAS